METDAVETTESYIYAPIESIEDQLCNKSDVVMVGSIAVPIFFFTVVILSLFGNILVLVILGLYESLKSSTNIFILNLAVSDLLFTLGLPFWACYHMWGWTLGDGVCKGVNFVFSAGFYSSIMFLMVMTVQRYVAVVHPLSDWERGQRFTVFAFLVWLVSVLASLPAVLKSSVLEEDGKLYCEYDSRTMVTNVTYTQNSFFVFSFVVMSFCYIRILQTMIKSKTNKKHKTIRLIFCIVAVFFVGWAPYNVVIFLQTLTFYKNDPRKECEISKALDYAEYGSKLLAFSHCCLNPIFYVFVGVKFRSHLKGIMHKIFQRQRNTPPQPARTVQSKGSMY